MEIPSRARHEPAPSRRRAGLLRALMRRSGWLSSWLALCHCSSSGPDAVLPYPVGQAMVFGSAQSDVITSLLGSCSTEVCAVAHERCGVDAYAEVLVAARGQVLDVLCYSGDLTVREIGPGPFEKIGGESDTVLVFDALDDGADVLGDVVINGHDSVLYGAGADVSVLGAGLRVDGQRTLLRGLTIRGNVSIDRNDVKLSLMQVNGDLTINGDGVTLSESVVHGEVLVVGTGAVLSRNLLAGTARLSGTNLACNLNQRFDDDNRDLIIDDAELGPEITCP